VGVGGDFKFLLILSPIWKTKNIIVTLKSFRGTYPMHSAEGGSCTDLELDSWQLGRMIDGMMTPLPSWCQIAVTDKGDPVMNSQWQSIIAVFHINIDIDNFLRLRVRVGRRIGAKSCDFDCPDMMDNKILIFMDTWHHKASISIRFMSVLKIESRF